MTLIEQSKLDWSQKILIFARSHVDMFKNELFEIWIFYILLLFIFNSWKALQSCYVLKSHVLYSITESENVHCQHMRGTKVMHPKCSKHWYSIKLGLFPSLLGQILGENTF